MIINISAEATLRSLSLASVLSHSLNSRVCGSLPSIAHPNPRFARTSHIHKPLSEFLNQRMKLQKTNKGQFYLTLPRALVEAKGWDKGTKVKVKLNEKGNLELEEK